MSKAGGVERHTLDDLLKLMQRLRDPQTGCPWDIKQDFDSIVAHTLEEVYEVVEAIKQKDYPHLAEELGDLLFQVVFYAQLGAEEEHFDFAEILDTLVTKLIRRHPHVFPEGTLESVRDSSAPLCEEQIATSWQAIKKQETLLKGNSRPKGESLLDEVNRYQPAHQRALELQQAASKVGFDWDDPLKVIAKMREELDELEEAIAEGQQEEIVDELGDFLFASINLARHLGTDPETAIRGCNNKFYSRFNYIEKALKQRQQPFAEASLEEMEALWQAAKAHEKKAQGK